MNALEHLLDDELNRLLDRIAAATRPGTIGATAGQHPDLRARIEQAESRLAGLRAALLARYAEWQEGIEECENLWAVAELESDGPSTPSTTRSRRAA
ncbi:MAG TPA: hypothetical protein VFO18_04190 [Methylomirabilota bacterium]|nr:hypothetical protein [Methylomirabilota bacterium]